MHCSVNKKENKVSSTRKASKKGSFVDRSHVPNNTNLPVLFSFFIFWAVSYVELSSDFCKHKVNTIICN
jgi:hypothetical protein